MTRDDGQFGFLAEPDAKYHVSSTFTDFAYKDRIASLEFFEIPTFGNANAQRRLACEQLLLEPTVAVKADTITVSTKRNYDECLESAWFDLFEVKELRFQYFATYTCEGEDFSDLQGLSLGEVRRHWQDRGRCIDSKNIQASWAYEIRRDSYLNDFELEPTIQDVRSKSVWRLAMMASDGLPCHGQWQEGDFRWVDCEFGMRMKTEAVWIGGRRSDSTDDVVYRGRYKDTHSLGTGYFLKGGLHGRLAQWQGEVKFAIDPQMPRLTPDRPRYEFKFRKEVFSGRVVPED